MAKELETQVALLEKEITSTREVFSKLDSAIEKISDVSNCINKMLAVHEQKIAQTEQDTEDLFHLVEKRRLELNEDMKELHSRITTGQREAQKEAHAQVDKIMNAIGDLKVHIEQKDLKQDEARWKLEQKMADLEKRQWFILGAASILGVLFGNMDFLMSLMS
jgi:ABC-type transporter Mla subunit MlaD